MHWDGGYCYLLVNAIKFIQIDKSQITFYHLISIKVHLLFIISPLLHQFLSVPKAASVLFINFFNFNFFKATDEAEASAESVEEKLRATDRV